ncbi:MAG: hypothetical protein IPP28_11440 [Xanthomonadales bacterium]|nr:hypothetical protein [Xanthomonadales bacterium]
MTASPKGTEKVPWFLVIPIPRAHASAHGICVRRVRVVLDQDDTELPDVVFDGFALVDEKRNELQRLFVVSARGRCLLEWLLVRTPEGDGSGPPSFESARRLRTTCEEDPQ